MESDGEIEEDIETNEEIDEDVPEEKFATPVRCSSAKEKNDNAQSGAPMPDSKKSTDLKNLEDSKNPIHSENPTVDEQEKEIDVDAKNSQDHVKEENEAETCDTLKKKRPERENVNLERKDEGKAKKSAENYTDNLDDKDGAQKTKNGKENRTKEMPESKEKEGEEEDGKTKKVRKNRKKKDEDEQGKDEGIVEDAGTQNKRRRRKNSAVVETETVGEIEDDVFGEEEEEEETEMTEEEKEDMYEAVRNGEYVQLQDLLDKKNADINMTWYNENLLMVALRSNQIVMAEFLIDNGIDVNYTTTLLELHKNKTRKRFQRYKMSCRQLAYDLGHLDIVEQIDVKNNSLHKYYRPTPRYPRMRRPPAPEAPKFPWEIEEEEEDFFSDEEEMFGDTQQETYTSRSAMNPTSSARTKNESELLETDPYFSNEIQVDVPDEGYGTISPVSPVPSPVKALRELVEERPGLLRRGTRSSLTRETYNSEKYRITKSADHIHSMRRKTSPVREPSQPRKKSEFSEKETCTDFASFHSETPTRIHVSPSHFITSGFDMKRKAFRPRPFSSPASPLAQVTKILNQSKLLSNKYTEPGLPYIKSESRKVTTKVVTPWCHGNSTGVFEQLSNTKIFNAIMQQSVTVNRQLYTRRTWSAKR